MLLYQPPQPSRTSYVYSGKTTNTQAESTLKFNEKRLPPINPQILSGIKRNLDNALNVDTTQILTDIKSDPALFIQCARRLPSIVPQGAASMDPLKALQSLEESQLREMFCKPFPAARDHRIDKLTKQQALSLKVTIACAKYAEALAQKVALPSHSGFTNSVFQQIGLNIVSWNYPSLYSRVMSEHRLNGVNINEEIEKVLGISSARLGQKLAQQWGIHLLSPGVSQKTSDDLKQILELAEICAKCEDPHNYPEAQLQLEEREKELSRLLNAQEIYEIQASIDGNMARYAQVAPVVSTLLPPGAVPRQSSRHLAEQVAMQRNPFISRLDIELRGAFEEIYGKLEAAKVSIEAIKTVSEKVIPLVGFRRGCLFLMSKQSEKLQPALRFGDMPLPAYAALLDNSDSNLKDSVDMLTPLRKDCLGVNGDAVSCIFSSLNHLRHEGVLYLEIDKDCRNDEHFNATLLFQAIRQSIKDCLDGR